MTTQVRPSATRVAPSPGDLGLDVVSPHVQVGPAVP